MGTVDAAWIFELIAEYGPKVAMAIGKVIKQIKAGAMSKDEVEEALAYLTDDDAEADRLKGMLQKGLEAAYAAADDVLNTD